MSAISDVRFSVPLYTVGEAARILDVPTSTFRSWARGYVRRSPTRPEVTGEAIVTALPPNDADPTIPFIGLAEGVVLAAIRRHGVPLQRIRPALDALRAELGIEHALASSRLYTDGAVLLYDYADRQGEPAIRDLVTVRSGQLVFSELIDSYLKRITFADDGWAKRIALPQYGRATVIADPDFSFGQPTFSYGRARVADVLERFWAGEDLDELGEEFGVPKAELEDAVRVASRRAA